VSTVRQKIAAQLRGLGVGYLPRHIVQPQLDDGTLVNLPLVDGRIVEPMYAVWKKGNKGRALRWFVVALQAAAGRYLDGNHRRH